jgi:hypothetical protein
MPRASLVGSEKLAGIQEYYSMGLIGKLEECIRIDWGTTYGNMGVNAAFNTGFCGSGSASCRT